MKWSTGQYSEIECDKVSLSSVWQSMLQSCQQSDVAWVSRFDLLSSIPYITGSTIAESLDIIIKEIELLKQCGMIQCSMEDVAVRMRRIKAVQPIGHFP